MNRDRPKLPAYGKALLSERRAGNHPAAVQVIVGRPWQAELAGVPVLALAAEDWAPGRFDWTPCAGVAVEVIDRGMERWQDLAQLAGEIARVAAPVMVRSPFLASGRAEVSELAWCLSAEGRGQWPAWWGANVQGDYDRRWARFYGQFVS